MTTDDSEVIYLSSNELRRTLRDIVYMLFRGSGGSLCIMARPSVQEQGQIQLWKDGRGVGRLVAEYTTATGFYREVVEPLKGQVSEDAYRGSVALIRGLFTGSIEKHMELGIIDETQYNEYMGLVNSTFV